MGAGPGMPDEWGESGGAWLDDLELFKVPSFVDFLLDFLSLTASPMLLYLGR